LRLPIPPLRLVQFYKFSRVLSTISLTGIGGNKQKEIELPMDDLKRFEQAVIQQSFNAPAKRGRFFDPRAAGGQ
jgi:hypothetical protein